MSEFYVLGTLVEAIYDMPVGNTGIIFFSYIPAIVRSWGLEYDRDSMVASNLRAASTLAQKSLVSGETFEFMRLSLGLTQTQAAAALGITLVDVQVYEMGLVSLPAVVWDGLAILVCKADNRDYRIGLTPCKEDYRPRRERVYPDTPIKPKPAAPGCFDPCIVKKCC